MDIIDRRKRYNRLWTMVFWPEATVEGYICLNVGFVSYKHPYFHFTRR